MINVLILINLAAALLVGCNEDDGADQDQVDVDLSAEADVSGDGETLPSEGGEIVPGTKQLQQRADLSVLPPNVDPDQDNIPNQLIPSWDRIDNCPEVFNPVQDDSDGDGVGDACDPN